MTPRDPLTVAVVGGGLAGLALTERLQSAFAHRGRGETVLCLEASSRAGGKLRSEREDGFLCEWGPHGFPDDAEATLDLVDRLGLGDDLISALPDSTQRFLYRRGRLRKIPTGSMGPMALLTSGVMPPLGILRMMLEPLVPQRHGGTEESIYEFFSRRLGTRAARILADAMVSDLYAGDLRRLAMPACFPAILKVEQKKSFREGMGQLAEALGRRIGKNLQLNCSVESIAGMGQRGFRIIRSSGSPFESRTVVFATPAPVSANLLAPELREVANGLASLPYASMVVLHLGYHRSVVGSLPQGAGFLVPRNEGLRILGSVWTDQLFPHRAAADRRLLTVTLGGAHDPDAIHLEDAELLRIARKDLFSAVGIEAAPTFTRIHRQPQAIPQYTLGHLQRLLEWEQQLSHPPGLYLAGSSYRGHTIDHCIVDAGIVCDRVLADIDDRRLSN